MLIALLADIHANAEALEACLADAAQTGVDRYVVLGDLVGYGADPVRVIERIADLMANGAIVVRGNHDAAAAGAKMSLNPIARAAIEWTRRQLDDSHCAFLDGLALEHREEDRHYVHASACAPSDWIYVTGAREAFQSFRATTQRLTFCGHTHVPALFNESPTSMPQQHTPVPGRAIPLLPQRRWLAVLGAVGQPRDHNAEACYGLLDTAANRMTWRRVPYDIDVTARKIRAAGLPDALARRLYWGS